CLCSLVCPLWSQRHRGCPEKSTAVVDLIEEFLCGGASLFVFGEVVWVGGHGEDLFEFSAGVVVAAHFLVRLSQVQMKKRVWFAKAQALLHFCHSSLRVSAGYAR